VPRYRADEGIPVDSAQYAALIEPYGTKYAWFMEGGYQPHLWQDLFHTMPNPNTGRLARFRHLVAGRRGGKTMSAAEELAFYAANPTVFHWDAHGERSDRGLWCWVLAKDHPATLPALIAFRASLERHGLVNGKDYKENRGNRWFEFANGSFVQFKSADEPEGLRGAGLDILWIDEAAFIPSEDAWNVVRPALSDKLGLLISTTTPSGKNWFFDEFWSDTALEDPAIGRVEYWSIHNPYFPKEEWEYAKRTMHPLLFKQEYMASFDSMAGKELHGDWLTYYTPVDLPRDPQTKQLKLRTYLGVDPAISLSEKADSFAMALVGVTEDRSTAFLLELFKGRLPFAEQLDLIHQWWTLPPNGYPRPDLIGVEAVAFQAALAQQLEKMPGFPPVVPIMTKDKKWKRILGMSPWFKLGRVRIRKDHNDFISEWVDYDSQLKNPKDDCLDAVELALRTAGVLLPSAPKLEPKWGQPAGSLEELARRLQPSSKHSEKWKGVDEHLGDDW
jgi:hypothetical protein